MTLENSRNGLHLDLDLNVLNHLGIGLYTNTPAVLTEIIANGWDADATEIHIDIEDDGEDSVIRIRDNGIGMNHNDLQDKFLTVGYARRKHGEEKTPNGRQCMGRKGIGKLAMFSLADEIHLISCRKDSDPQGFIVNVGELRLKIGNNEHYYPAVISDTSSYPLFSTGTTIVLKKLNKRVNRTESFLRRRIARRFSILGENHKFKIYTNGKEVTIKDRDFYEDIQLLWTFGNAEAETLQLCSKHRKHAHFEGIIPDTDFQINGFIAGVVKPAQLKKNDDNNNTITLLANGRIFDEDVKKRLDDAKVFNSYLVGELQADFIDSNDGEDMAASSRQGVLENDPRFITLVNYVKLQMGVIANQWDEWRREIGAEEIEEEIPEVTAWLNSLGKNETKARQLISKLNTMRFRGNESEQVEQKREVLRHQILAFEKLRINDNLEAIESINIETDVEKFADILLSIEDIEAMMHYEIVQQRLSVIRKLERHSADGVRESIVQNHIYKHMWLVDPSLEHSDEPTEIELTLTKYLKKNCPDTTEGARIDLGYRTVSGKFIVLELKRPKLSVSFEKLRLQGAKYRKALRQYFKDNPGSCPVPGEVPTIEIVFVVDKRPNDSHSDKEYYEGELRNINATIWTYTDLINQALKTYDEYLKASRKALRIKAIVDAV